MPRSPSQRNRDFVTSSRGHKIPVDIAELFIPADIVELFSCPPLEVGEFFEGPIVRTRIGMLITRAMDKRGKHHRVPS
jgi:hypothetical protein